MLRKKLKLTVMALMLAAIQVICCMPVNAATTSTATVRYINTDFSLDNREVLIKVMRTANTLADIVGAECTAVGGPYNAYYVNENGNVELDHAVFNLYFSNGKRGIYKLGIPGDPNGLGGQGYIVDSDSDEFITEPHIFIGNNSATYAVTEKGTAMIDNNLTSESLSVKQSNKALQAASGIGKDLLKKSCDKTISWFNLLIKASLMGVLLNTNPDPVGIEVPNISQFIPGESPGTEIGSNCYFACVTSIVQCREPVAFGDLTVSEVQDDFLDIDPTYGRLEMITIDEICDAMHELYLDSNSATVSHESHTSATSYDNPVTMSSYKAIINNGCLMLAMFGSSSANVHAVVMCQYIEHSDGDIQAICMDPLEEEYITISWNDSNRLSLGNWAQDHELEYREMIINSK